MGSPIINKQQNIWIHMARKSALVLIFVEKKANSSRVELIRQIEI
jgi:hypothetical protein